MNVVNLWRLQLVSVSTDNLSMSHRTLSSDIEDQRQKKFNGLPDTREDDDECEEEGDEDDVEDQGGRVRRNSRPVAVRVQRWTTWVTIPMVSLSFMFCRE